MGNHTRISYLPTPDHDIVPTGVIRFTGAGVQALVALTAGCRVSGRPS